MSVTSKLPLVFLYTDNSQSIHGATRFQKLVFLAQNERNLANTYEFRPDRYGPYSPALRADLEELERRGWIERDIITNNYGQPKVIYGLTEDGVQEVQRLVSDNNKTVFDIVQDIKREYNYQPLTQLLQYVYRKYDGYVDATDLDVDALFDPDVKSEFEQADPADHTMNATIGEELLPTPHTLWQMPKRDTEAYFYYFTDDAYKSPDSIFKTLDDQLTLLGRNRQQLEVAIIDRDRVRPEVWNVLLEGLDIDDYPALVVAEQELGVRDVDLTSSSFTPNDANYAVIENGIITDDILSDTDETRDFLTGLFDAALDNEIESGMRKEKVMKGLTISAEKLGNVLSLVR